MKNLKELGIIAGIDYVGVGVGAVILNEDGHILLGLRSGVVRNDAGKWDCPGGGGKPGESLVKAIIRECEEEIGVLVMVEKQLPYVEQFVEGQHWISCAFVCKIVSGTPKIMEPHKCADLEWFTLEGAKTLDLTETTRLILEML